MEEVSALKITVELRKHIGQKRGPLGVENIEHDQFMVFAKSDQQAKPIQVGYIGKKEGNPFNGLPAFRDLSPGSKKQIVDQTKVLLKEALGYTWDPVVFEPAAPPEVVAEYEDDGEE